MEKFSFYFPFDNYLRKYSTGYSEIFDWLLSKLIINIKKIFFGAISWKRLILNIINKKVNNLIWMSSGGQQSIFITINGNYVALTVLINTIVINSVNIDVNACTKFNRILLKRYIIENYASLKLITNKFKIRFKMRSN